MKRKWLIGLLALLMAIATCFGIVACGGGDEQASDEEIANKAITLLKSLYGDGETKASYKVLGQTKVDSNVYDVTWTVSSETENIEDYVKIGTMDESKQITIDISWGENAIEYTLTASVTVGSVTKTLDIKHTIPALGTVYTPSQVLELGAKLTHAEGSEETYYMENGEVAPLTVKGYVVYIDDSEKGGWNSEYKNLNRIYIGDTKDTAKEDALYVYRIVGDEVYLTGPDSIQVGDLVTLNGALEKFYETIELTYYESLSVTVLGIEKAERTDEEILAAAKNALKVTPSYFSQPGEYPLPVPASGVSVTWELTGADSNVKVENGKIIVSAIPDSETSYTLKATLTYGSAAAVTKEFTIQLGKLAVTHAGTQDDPYTPAEALTIAATLAEGTYYSDVNGVKAVYVKGKVVDTGSWSADFSNYNKVYIIDENSYTAVATQNSDGAIQIYRIAETSELTEGSLHHGDTLVVNCGIQNYGGKFELGSPTGDSKVNAADLADYTAVELTDEQKAKEVIDSIEIPTQLTTDFTLPVSKYTDVTLSFSSSDTTVVEVKEGALVVHRTATPATVTITATATINTVKETKGFSVTIPAETETPADATTVTVSIQEYATKNNWVAATNGEGMNYTAVDIDDNVKVTVSATAVGSYGLNSGKYYVTSDVGNWRIYANETPIIKFEGLTGVTIYTVKITYTTADDKIANLADNTESTTTYASDAVIEVNANSIEFTVTGKGHIRISAIEVTYKTGTETPGEPQTDEEKIKAALDSVKDRDITAVGTTNLETSYNDGEVTFSWATDTQLSEGISFENNVITVTALPETDVAIVFTVTATLGGGETAAVDLQSNQKTVTITVKAASTAEPGGDTAFTAITEPQAGTYKFAMKVQGGTYYYATGAMDGYFFATSENVEDAADFVITKLQDDNQYTITVGGKYLEIVPRTDGKTGVNIQMVDTQTEGKYWKWIAGIQNFVMESTYNKDDNSEATDTDLYYMGTYVDHNNMSGNYIGRIATGSGDDWTPNNKEGVDQWVAHFGTIGNGGTPAPGPEGGGGETAQTKSIELNATNLFVFAENEVGKKTFPQYCDGSHSVESYTFKTDGIASRDTTGKDLKFNAASECSIYNETPFPGRITKIEITVTSDSKDAFTLYVNSVAYTGTGDSTDNATTISETTTWTAAEGQSFTYFKLVKAKTTNPDYISSIKITYEDAAAEAAMEAPAMTAFTSNANGGLFRKKD